MQNTIIEAGRSEKHYWKDLWRFKELLVILALRDITVKYKQTFVGIAWAIFRPVLTVSVFVFAFDKVAKIENKSTIPLQVIIFTGVIFWNFFSISFQQVSNSITNNANLVSKVYFPRLLMPISSVAVPLLDFIVGFAVMIPFLIYKGFPPTINILFVPFFLILSFFASTSLGIIFASLNVQYRDFQQIAPLIVQYGFFVCPIAYPIASIQEKSWYPIYQWVNPLAGVIEGFRWCLIPNYQDFHWNTIIPSVIFISITTAASVIFFRKKEKSFVDYI